MAVIRRWWAIIAALAVAALAIAAVSITLVHRWLVWDPAPQLQQLVMSVPAPAGAHPSGDVSVVGHRPPHDLACGFTCQTEYAQRLWVPDDASVDVCAVLRQAVTRWAAVGFEESPPDPPTFHRPCEVDGTLRGHPAGGQAIRANGGFPAQITFAVRW